MRRKHERQYWDGFRDALVMGSMDPGKPEGTPIATAEEPFYRRGFKDGERAVERIRDQPEGEAQES